MVLPTGVDLKGSYLGECLFLGHLFGSKGLFPYSLCRGALVPFQLPILISAPIQEASQVTLILFALG